MVSLYLALCTWAAVQRIKYRTSLHCPTQWKPLNVISHQNSIRFNSDLVCLRYLKVEQEKYQVQNINWLVMNKKVMRFCVLSSVSCRPHWKATNCSKTNAQIKSFECSLPAKIRFLASDSKIKGLDLWSDEKRKREIRKCFLWLITRILPFFFGNYFMDERKIDH